jgi:hypothetical protein
MLMSLGGIAKPKQSKSVIGLFRRESGTGGDSDSSQPSGSIQAPVIRDRDRRSGSISTHAVYEIDSTGHSAQFPVTASHRRNTRKGSLLEVSG